MNQADELRKLCEQRGFQLIEKPNGHFQINGKLLVNYYPFSKDKTAYIAQTKNGFKHVRIAGRAIHARARVVIM